MDCWRLSDCAAALLTPATPCPAAPPPPLQSLLQEWAWTLDSVPEVAERRNQALLDNEAAFKQGEEVGGWTGVTAPASRVGIGEHETHGRQSVAAQPCARARLAKP